MRAERHDERRDCIVGAARALFIERGFPATGMDDIAGAAGMAAGTLYNYFPSKEALLVAVFDRELAGLLTRSASFPNVRAWARAALATYAHFPRDRWRQFMAAFYGNPPGKGLASYQTQFPLRAALRGTVARSLGRNAASGEADQCERILFSVFYQGFLRWLNAGDSAATVTRDVVADMEAVMRRWRSGRPPSHPADAVKRRGKRI
jgi:AcrR family transcriptional regulator